MVDELYVNAVTSLTSQGKFYINLGLDRVTKVLDLIGNPQNKLKIIHIAGTNGKGSVAAFLSSILKFNYKTGLFTSPHVFEYTERIKINDEEISKQIFADKIITIINLANKNNIHLTEFEILTVVAFQYFAQNNVDIVVLETGLGGRLDATNVIDKNICSVITNIDYDHTERLGDTIEKIAFEKAGIIKQNSPVVISAGNKGFAVVKKVADAQNSAIALAKKTPISLLAKSALQGVYQQQNLELTLTVISELKHQGYEISEKNIEDGVKTVNHPCRFEFLTDYNLIIDGAHNPNGAKVLRESLDKKFPNRKFRFIFGCLKNKKYKEMMKNLFTGKDEIYFYQFKNPNAATYSELEKACPFVSNVFEDFNFDTNIPTVVCGSFYMLKELLKKIGIK